MDIIRIVGWLLVAGMLYAALQGFIGLREYRARVAQERAAGKTIADRAVSEVVMRGGVGYFATVGIELGLAAIAIWLLTRA